MTEMAKSGSMWKQINQPFIASTDIPDEQGELTLMHGNQKRTAEIAAIRVLHYGPNFNLEKLPRQRVTSQERYWLHRICRHRIVR